jgi:hypothetical protein
VENNNHQFADFYKNLKALSSASFPKKCNTCGKVYNSVEDFITKTESIRGKTGLKKSITEDSKAIVELFRNCVCGSTLMDCFNNRRDLSERGQQRRETFEKVLVYLVKKGVEKEKARQEILKIMRGEKSELLTKLGGAIKSN